MKQVIQKAIEAAITSLQQASKLPAELSYKIQVERTKNPDHGDFATNIAMLLTKQAEMKPRDLAQLLINAISNSDQIKKVEIAGPGFINFFISETAQSGIVQTILEKGNDFGRSTFGKNERVHIEFVSANPTGPLHVGHGRGAAYGAACADLLEAVGYKVHREYYVNDAGRQMDILAISVWLRYLETCENLVFDFPSNGYKGDYIFDIAAKLREQCGDELCRPMQSLFEDVPPDETDHTIGGDKEAHIDGLIKNAKNLLGEDYVTLHHFGMQSILNDIRDDLADFGVTFQEWFSEAGLFKSEAIKKGLDALRQGNHLYEENGATWFKSTQYGDEKDRVLVRDNGQTTYFASDVAYHWNKLDRGYQHIIDVFGADHHGYVPRVRAAMEALGLNHDALHVPLVQFAILYRNGQRAQMSTRSGEFVTLRELREEVGKDAARFFYVMRKPEQHLDFDLDLAKSKSNENPVYYIQYAHARVCSVFRQLGEKGLRFDKALGLSSLETLTEEHEKNMLTLLAKYPELLQQAAERLEPHQLVTYLKELATAFHTYYNAHKFITDDTKQCNARLCLIMAARQVIKNGLELLGVSAPEAM